MLNKYVEGRVIFDEVLSVKLTLYQQTFDVWGVWKDEEGPHLMDAAGNWHGPLKETQLNAPQVIASLYQRLKQMSHAGAVAN